LAQSGDPRHIKVVLDRQAHCTRAGLIRDGQRLAEVALAGDPPAWLEPTLRTMAELLDLPDNWNSYGANPIDPAQVAWALDLLARTMKLDSPTPTVVPTSHGGVELEWHLRGVDLEVHAISPRGVYFYCQDHVRGTEEERELDGDLSPLVDALTELARRG
jgi:hypothetical protein